MNKAKEMISKTFTNALPILNTVSLLFQCYWKFFEDILFTVTVLVTVKSFAL